MIASPISFSFVNLGTKIQNFRMNVSHYRQLFLNLHYFLCFLGESQIGEDIEPLDPASVASIVQFGRKKTGLNRKAVGYSLVYSQLFPFEGFKNYTSGIIHHVRLTGTDFSMIRTSTIPATCQ